ncbi:DUF2972 domain-containing protein, partial [Campylobacter sp.]|uniref:DUF2972 domain-containing protein n=1 Tax=Campylobacter sp. TaxID=205 RepID=UPI0026DB205C
AALAWELNLPLPRRYEFVFCASHGTGTSALFAFLKRCEVTWLEYHSWEDLSAFRVYVYFFAHLLAIPGYKILVFKYLPCGYKKLFALMDKKVDALFLLRDPFENWASYCNFSGRRDNFCESISWREDVRTAMDVFCFLNFPTSAPKMDENLLCAWERLDGQNKENCGHLFESHVIKWTKNLQNLHFIQTKDLHKMTAFETMKRLSKIFSFELLGDARLFEEQKVSNLNILFPRTIVFEHGCTIKIQTIYAGWDEGEFVDLKDRLYPRGGVFFDEIVLLVEREKLALIDEKSLVEYFKKFQLAIKERLDLQATYKLSPEHILSLFKKPSETRKKLKKLFDENFHPFKKYCPEIIASWKYYQEFERLCAKDALKD